MTTLQLNEIYYSVQGESSFAGEPCVFLRTKGCSLRCRWCDTPYSFHEGAGQTLEDILAAVRSYECPLVELTGGEPLDQPASFELLRRLCAERYTVLLETGGHKSIAEVDPRVHVIMDIKCPGSGMQKRNRLANLALLKPHHQVKFVIADRNDYEWARALVQEYELSQRVTVLFSPVAGEQSPRELAEWIVDDRLRVRFQVQLHKILWGMEAKSV
jgi:7-carboxy-7-deazaguanine synthase